MVQTLSPLSSEPNFSLGQRFSYWVLIVSVIIVLVISNNMWFYPVNDESDPSFGYTPGARLLYNSMLACLMGCVVFFYRHSLYFCQRNVLLCLLILVHYASLATSIEPSETFAYSFRMLLFIAFFGISATLISEKDWMKLLIVFFGISAVLNLVYIIVMPKYGLMGGIHSGKWRGLFSHKNIFSYFCAYGFVMFALVAMHKNTLRNRLISLLGAMIYLLMILKSHSSGALTCAGAGVMAGGVFIFTPRVSAITKAVLISTLVFIMIAVAPIFDEVITFLLGLLGRDPTLTNRSFIWDLYLAEYAKSPIFGLGANAYLFNVQLLNRIANALQMDQAPTPHNGYIAILIQIGVVGLFVYGLIVGRIILLGLKESLSGKGIFLHKIFLVFTIMHLTRGMVETGGSIKLSPYFAFIVVGYVMMTRHNRLLGKQAALPAEATEQESPAAPLENQ